MRRAASARKAEGEGDIPSGVEGCSTTCRGVEAEPVAGLRELEPVLEELRERLAAGIHVIENAELHCSLPLAPQARPDRDVTS
jgi:hypothetical protein